MIGDWFSKEHRNRLSIVISFIGSIGKGVGYSITTLYFILGIYFNLPLLISSDNLLALVSLLSSNYQMISLSTLYFFSIFVSSTLISMVMEGIHTLK